MLKYLYKQGVTKFQIIHTRNVLLLIYDISYILYNNLGHDF